MFQPEGKPQMNYKANKGLSFIKEHCVTEILIGKYCVFPIRY